MVNAGCFITVAINGNDKNLSNVKLLRTYRIFSFAANKHENVVKIKMGKALRFSHFLSQVIAFGKTVF